MTTRNSCSDVAVLFLCSEFFVMSNFVETLYTNEMLEFQHFKGVLCYNYFRHVIG